MPTIETITPPVYYYSFEVVVVDSLGIRRTITVSYGDYETAVNNHRAFRSVLLHLESNNIVEDYGLSCIHTERRG